MDEIVRDFLIESGENLDRLDRELVLLESEPNSSELLASIFRTIHTIKGSCGFLGFANLEKVAHAGESMLSRLREGKISLTADVTSALLATVDVVRRMLSEIQASGQDGGIEYSTLLQTLASLQERVQAAQSEEESDTKDSKQVSEPRGEGPQAKAEEQEHAPLEEAKPDREVPATANPGSEGKDLSQRRPSPGKLGGVLVERGQISAEDLALALAEQEHGDQRRVGEILVGLGLCKQEEILAAQQILEMRGRAAGVETVRVGVTLLDRLMNLVGELVLARNQLLQWASQDAGFHTIAQRMNLIAGELQEEVMKTRMQPIGNVWNKFPRTVRDLALNCGKEVRLEMEGQETELDRTLLEAVKDPLTHLVRNAVDHGIESPEVRTRRGKPACGCVRLRAFHESGQVNIEITDDGAGLDVERIRAKAIERGLISADQSLRMRERELFNLIFQPGFSTAEKVTNVSGRGVGMDVVRTNLEKIGGTVELQSIAGKGTTVRTKIPLTLAIVPALVVRCAGQRFAIPQMSLTELVRLESSDAVETVHGAPVYRLRGTLLPLVWLHEVLHPAEASQQEDRREATESLNIVVLRTGKQQFGLVVDDILDSEEIVVKPLSRHLKNVDVYAGATIMGDGSVALILDVVGLAQRSKLVGEDDGEQKEKSEAVGRVSPKDEQTLLLAEIAGESRVAIPLDDVARLEEFPDSVIEHAGPQEVMQYRGHIIPLVRLSQVLSAASAGTAFQTPSVQVVVYSAHGRTVGLIVDRIVDIVQERIVPESVHPRPGTTGTCVVGRRVTDLLDISAIVTAALDIKEPTIAETQVS